MVEQENHPEMKILSQFIKDASFENILAQSGNQSRASPDIKVQVNLDAKKRSNKDQYEVSLRLNITATSTENSEKLFHIELDYAGIFSISGVKENQLHPLLLVECPRVLFPYARRIVSDLTHDGGFPSLSLENIDFLKLYKEEAERRKKDKEGSSPKNLN